MNKNTTAPTSKKNSSLESEVIKIGIDIHKSKYVAVAQYGDQAPKAPQRFKPDAFLAWIKRSDEKGSNVKR